MMTANFHVRVMQARIAKGWTQERLAQELAKCENIPINAYTKQPYKFTRGWVAKLEVGLLRRGVPTALKELLAKVLGTNLDALSEVSISSTDDILPLIKVIAEISRLKQMQGDKFISLYAEYLQSKDREAFLNGIRSCISIT